MDDLAFSGDICQLLPQIADPLTATTTVTTPRTTHTEPSTTSTAQGSTLSPWAVITDGPSNKGGFLGLNFNIFCKSSFFNLTKLDFR